MITARWVATAFALLQVLAYAAMPYPPGIRTLALGLVAVLAIGNGVFALLERRSASPDASVARSVASFAFDIVIAMAFVTIYTFDPSSALWAILFTIPVDGAIRFGLPGALTGWTTVTLLYTAREIWGSGAFDYPFDWTSVTFRMGLMLIVGVAVGLLARDVDRERARLERALDELERVDRLRTQLIATLAHDIRGPLGLILGALNLLGSGQEVSADTHREVVELASRQAARMRLLATGLLDLARAENGVLELQRAPVALGPLLDRTVSFLEDHGGVTVEVPEGLVVEGDESRLEQVFINLLTNAQRHGATPIVVRAGEQAGGVEISVTAAGRGIDVARAAHLFEPFTAGTRTDSVGLGLWITHELTAAHGGHVAVDPPQPGSGATFRVWLPAGMRERSMAAHPAGKRRAAVNETASEPARMPIAG